MLWRIDNRLTGDVFGHFEGRTEYDALRVLAQEHGYRNHEEAINFIHRVGHTFVVTKVEFNDY